MSQIRNTYESEEQRGPRQIFLSLVRSLLSSFTYEFPGLCLHEHCQSHPGEWREIFRDELKESKSSSMTEVGYSVVELLIQIWLWQLLSIANYRLDKVLWLQCSASSTYEIVETAKESINCWINILQAKSKTHRMMKQKNDEETCLFSLFFNNDNQAVREREREKRKRETQRAREKRERKPLISTLSVWLFTLGCCQEKRSNDDDAVAVDFRQRRIMILALLRECVCVCSWWRWKAKLALFDMFQIWLSLSLSSSSLSFPLSPYCSLLSSDKKKKKKKRGTKKKLFNILSSRDKSLSP